MCVFLLHSSYQYIFVYFLVVLGLERRRAMEKEIELILDGLMTDGGHHKQWYLEQVLLSLLGEGGVNKKREELVAEYGWAWELGIPP